MLSRQHQLLAVAVMAALSLSACGKKKDLVSSQPAPTAEQQAQAQAQAEAEKKKQDSATMQDRRPGLGGGLEEGTADMPPSKRPGNLGGADLPPPPGPGGKRPQPTQPSRPAPTQPQQPQQEQQGHDPVAHNDSSTMRLTGGKADGGLVYTSAGDDNIHEILNARNGRVNEQSRRLNLQAASAVTGARLDLKGDSALVTVKINEQGGEKTYRLSGKVGGALQVDRNSSGDQAIEGSLQCLDANPVGADCATTFARLQVGSPGSSGIVNIIFRQSAAPLPFFRLPGERSGNPDYEKVRGFIISLIRGTVAENQVRQTRFDSWEVTNGRSGMIVQIKTVGGESIAYAGPLLADASGGVIETALTRVDEGGRSTYASLLGGAQLVSNNGAGKIQISISMKPNRSYARDTFFIEFKKTQTPIIDLR